MTRPLFVWTQPRGLGDDQHLCEWCGFILWAEPNGKWYVNQMQGDHHARTLVSSKHQVRGADLHEAKQRAQGAAICLHLP